MNNSMISQFLRVTIHTRNKKFHKRSQLTKDRINHFKDPKLWRDKSLLQLFIKYILLIILKTKQFIKIFIPKFYGLAMWHDNVH